MAVSQGIITARGGATSHAAVVARQIGKPCVAGSRRPPGRLRRRRGPLQRDAAPSSRRATGSASTARPARSTSGALPTVEARFEDQPELQTILGWADGIRRMGVWTNADKPEEAAQARSYGAQGIGLCRTEHMFREGERLEIVRGAILVASGRPGPRPRRAAGEQLTSRRAGGRRDVRRRDGQARGPPAGRLRGHLQGDGRPAGRHPPDRPAAPRVPAEPRGAARQGHRSRRSTAARRDEDKELLATIRSLHEQNPMLGLRGCRLGLMIPDFVKIQTRAILNAQIAVKKAGGNPIAKIMIPLVGHVNELAATRRAPREGGDGGPRGGRRRRGRLQVRDDDRGPARRPDRRRDRPRGRLLQLRHERPDPDDVRLQPRRRRGRLPAEVRRGQDPAGQPVPDARRRGRRADEDRGRQGPLDEARPRARDLRRARRRPGVDLRSARRSGSTTCRARRSASRSPGSRRPRPRWPAPRSATSRPDRPPRRHRDRADPPRGDRRPASRHLRRHRAAPARSRLSLAVDRPGDQRDRQPDHPDRAAVPGLRPDRFDARGRRPDRRPARPDPHLRARRGLRRRRRRPPAAAVRDPDRAHGLQRGAAPALAPAGPAARRPVRRRVRRGRPRLGRPAGPLVGDPAARPAGAPAGGDRPEPGQLPGRARSWGRRSAGC